MRVETRFETVDDLVGVQAHLGPTGQMMALLIVDTGAVLTTVVPRVAESIGYSSAHMLAPSIKRTAAAVERGYIVSCDVTALGFRMRRHPIDVVELGHGIDGLLGVAFLSQFNFELRYSERRIIVEPIAS